MPALILLRNPLSQLDKEVHELPDNARPIDWLQDNYPTGFGMPIRVFVNANEIELDDLDMELEPDDVVVVALTPAGLETILTSILISVVLSAVSMGIGLLFQQPQTPPFEAQAVSTPSPVYSVKNNQNSARLGEPVPVVYGTVMHTPDYCSQPYTFYSGYPGEMYVDILMVLSQGEVEVKDVVIGDTSVSSLEPGILQYAVFPPAAHQGRMGYVSHVFPDFHEDVVTSPEVGTQQFDVIMDVGWFDLSRTGKRGSQMRFDFEFPGGLYEQDGQINKAATTYIWIYWEEVDADGNYVGLGGFHEERFHDESVTPVRRTVWINTGRSGMWRVKVRRPANVPYSQHRSQWIWRGAKLIADITPGAVYGDVTLMAVRMKGTKGIADNAQQKIRVLMTRKLPRVEDDVLVATTSPADAFADIHHNAVYGGRRPADELDYAKLRLLKQYWNGYEFNAVYTGKTTIWEALVNSVQGVAAAPLPIGSFMSVQQDGLKPVRSMIFTEQNIAAGSLSLTYDFDPVGRTDCIEVEYRDPSTFSPAYVKYPTGGVDPDKVKLFGCTDKTHALEYARLLWQRRTYQRRFAEFDTELEGLIPHLGERIALAHTMPKWGASGIVAKVSNLNLTLDKPVDWTPGALVIMLRAEDGSVSDPISITKGATAYDVVLNRLPPFAMFFDERQENTHYAIGPATTIVRDFILTDIRPKGGTVVTLTGVNYDERSFTNTFPFLERPV